MAALVRDVLDVDVVALATNGVNAHALTLQLSPDVAVLDVHMPDMDGFAVAQRLREENSSTRLIALSFQDDPVSFRRALDVGFRGYVMKRSPWASLLSAIRSVVGGGLYIDPYLANGVLERSLRRRFAAGDSGEAASRANLTSREEEVLRQIARGFTLKEVAAQLGVTEKSIETYKTRASGKLKLGSRASIVAYAINQGWFDGARG